VTGPTSADEGSRPITVSAVIVNWNSKDEVLACLESLQQHPPEVPWEAIVVDNGSADGSVAALKSEMPWVRVIANTTNRGLPAANNQGMLAARGEAFLISNPDVLWHAGAVDALLDLLTRRPRASWVVPRLLFADGTLQTSAGDLPGLVAALAGKRAQRRLPTGAAGLTSGVWWTGWAHDEERVIGRGHECAYLVRRQAVEEVGLQDEGYPLDWEGVDWTDRMRQAGWETWLCPSAEAVHLGGASIRQVPYRWIISSHRGMYRYFAARRPPAARPAIAAVVATRAGVKLAVAAAGVAVYEAGHRSGRVDSTPNTDG
jgi:N-acetylglucosaminyl-diphospho-decaprenol L-rhamnosyltransferase